MEYSEYVKRFEEVGIRNDHMLTFKEYESIDESCIEMIIDEIDNFIYVSREEYINGRRTTEEDIKNGKYLYPAAHWAIKRHFNIELSTDYFGTDGYFENKEI